MRSLKVWGNNLVKIILRTSVGDSAVMFRLCRSLKCADFTLQAWGDIFFAICALDFCSGELQRQPCLLLVINTFKETYWPSGRTVLELRIGDAPVTGTVLTRRSADFALIRPLLRYKYQSLTELLMKCESNTLHIDEWSHTEANNVFILLLHRHRHCSEGGFIQVTW